jgi:hypothetical protein
MGHSWPSAGAHKSVPIPLIVLFADQTNRCSAKHFGSLLSLFKSAMTDAAVFCEAYSRGQVPLDLAAIRQGDVFTRTHILLTATKLSKVSLRTLLHIITYQILRYGIPISSSIITITFFINTTDRVYLSNIAISAHPPQQATKDTTHLRKPAHSAFNKPSDRWSIGQMYSVHIQFSLLDQQTTGQSLI